MNQIIVALKRIGALTFLAVTLAFTFGCDQTTGIENKPPPKGGPPKSTGRRPPGEVNSPNTR